MQLLFVNRTTWIVLMFTFVAATQSADALRKRPTWGITTRVLPDAQVGGWFINLGITGARAKILLEAPKTLEVAYIFDDTPAAGKLMIGDKIIGANGRPFSDAHKFGYGVDYFGYEGPMMDFGNALEESQGSLDGKLTLDVVRGETRMRVVITLPKKYGAFSKTYPYDCDKTDIILGELYAYLTEKQRDDGIWHGRPHINAFAALALLASGKEEHLTAVRRAAKACAAATSDKIEYGGLDCWKYGLYGAFLGEYYLITREDWVLDELQQINDWLHKAQLVNGGWGHRPANRPGGNGYGAINVITMQAKMAWALMMRCGLKVDAEKYQAAHEFVAKGTNDFGYVWYKDGGRKNANYADMGRTGASATAHYLSPVGGKTYSDFAKLNARCIGTHPTTFPDTHGSPLLGMVWTSLGALPDPTMFRKLMNHNRWHFALAQCPDGTFYYQPNRDNNPQDFTADPRLCASAVTALILSAKNKRLQMTGAKPVSLIAAKESRKPNILLIMVDDLGWMDLHCQGNSRLHTPNIDQLAEQGMRFTDAYAAAPVCSPTRAAVLTGLAPARLKITNHIPDQARFTPKDAKLLPAKMLDHLPQERVTIAERLKEAGYVTGFFGKWHLAGPRIPKKQGQGDLRFYPEKQGFDINLGGTAMGGPFSFFDPYDLHNLPSRKEGQYMPDRFADELIEFIGRNRDRPFLAFLWNYTVHWPMEAPADLIEKYKKRKDLGRLDPRYAAMIEAMDASIGRIMKALDDLRLTDDTLVIFTSDNGAFGGVADMAPLRAAKGYLYEGGIRVPQIVRWPGVVERGSLCDVPVISMDFFPTILDAVGLESGDPLDGESLMPLLKQTGSLQRSEICFHYPNYAFHQDNRLGSAIRQGDYKLIERFDDGSVELYNLKADIGEKNNLANKVPDRAKELVDKLRAWRTSTKAELPIARIVAP